LENQKRPDLLTSRRMLSSTSSIATRGAARGTRLGMQMGEGPHGHWQPQWVLRGPLGTQAAPDQARLTAASAGARARATELSGNAALVEVCSQAGLVLSGLVLSGPAWPEAARLASACVSRL
jgi:hypothetical protein